MLELGLCFSLGLWYGVGERGWVGILVGLALGVGFGLRRIYVKGLS